MTTKQRPGPFVRLLVNGALYLYMRFTARRCTAMLDRADRLDRRARDLRAKSQARADLAEARVERRLCSSTPRGEDPAEVITSDQRIAMAARDAVSAALPARPANMPEPTRPSRSWLYFEGLHTRFHRHGDTSECGGYWPACDLFFVYLSLLPGKERRA